MPITDDNRTSNSYPAVPEDEIDILAVLETFVAWRWLLIPVFIATVVLAAAAAGVYRYLSYSPSYKATAHILSEPSPDLVGEMDQIQSAHRGKRLFAETFEVVLRSSEFLRSSLEQSVELPRYEGRKLFEILDGKNAQETIEAFSSTIKVQNNPSHIALSVTTKDPELSAAIANMMVENLGEHYRNIANNNVKVNLDYARARLKEVKAEMEDAWSQYAQFLEANRQFKLYTATELAERFPLLAAKMERLKEQAQRKSLLYNNIEEKYEIINIEARKDLPFLSVLKYAAVPDKPLPRNLLKITVMGAFLGALAAVSMFVLAYLLSQTRAKNLLEPFIADFRLVTGKLFPKNSKRRRPDSASVNDKRHESKILVTK